MQITPPTLDWYGIRLYGFMLFFVIAGIGHLVKPKAFASIIPFMPYKMFIVYITGVMEIALGIGLLFEPYRMITVWLTIWYLLAIYPGNIYMALNHEKYSISKRALYIRLPFQFLFILWVYSLLL